MSTSNGTKLCLKVVINKQKSKVLFAEANSEVVDVLLSFLTLPLGKLVKILEKHYGNKAPVVGSLTTLSRGLSNLDSSHFCMEGAKQMLLDPTSSFQDEIRGLKLNITDSQPMKLYYCNSIGCCDSRARNISLYPDIAKCDCGKPLITGVFVRVVPRDFFMIKAKSFAIGDDLKISPVLPAFLQTLKNLGITDTNGGEISSLSIDIDDIMDLLKFSLFSRTPLTDLVFKKTQKRSTESRPEPGVLLHHRIQINGDANSRSRKMTLKIFLQKSSSKFLLAVATDEFVEFLFSFLTVPLGGVEYLLGGNTCLKNIDNLYKSVTDVIDNKDFKCSDAKNRLINPKLPHGYVSQNQFLPLSEEIPPKITVDSVAVRSFKSSRGQGSFVKKQTMYIVSDDLTVTPFSITSSISIPNGLGIALSDVTEKDFQIGHEEALSILRASLSSTTPLTDVLLINLTPNKPPKRPKQEP